MHTLSFWIFKDPMIKGKHINILKKILVTGVSWGPKKKKKKCYILKAPLQKWKKLKKTAK